jgi:hypothetical protein
MEEVRAAGLPERLGTLEERGQELERATIFRSPFGAEEWSRYFGAVGIEPPLPPDIDQILDSPCPFCPGKQIRDTHLLVLIPATVNGEPFSLDLLGELIRHPRGGGYSTKYGYYDPTVQEQFGTQSPERSYWVLMTRDVLAGSRSETYASQRALVAGHANRTGLPYELPGVLEAATAILSHYVRSGERLYTDAPMTTDAPSTYTRCQEQVESLDDENGWEVEEESGGEGEGAPRYHGVVVGGFEEGGLDLGLFFNSENGIDRNYGVAGLRRVPSL